MTSVEKRMIAQNRLHLMCQPLKLQAVQCVAYRPEFTWPKAARAGHYTELSKILVSLFKTPSIMRTSRKTRSNSGRVGATIQATRSHAPFVVCNRRSSGTPRSFLITSVVDFPVTSIDMIA